MKRLTLVLLFAMHLFFKEGISQDTLKYTPYDSLISRHGYYDTYTWRTNSVFDHRYDVVYDLEKYNKLQADKLKYNGTIFFHRTKFPESIDLKSLKNSNIKFSETYFYKGVYAAGYNFGNIHIFTGYPVKMIDFHWIEADTLTLILDQSIDSLNIWRCNFNQLNITSTKFMGGIDLTGVTLNYQLVLKNNNMPASLKLNYLKIKNPDGYLDLRSNFIDTSKNHNPANICYISLYGFDFSKLLAPANVFDIAFNSEDAFNYRENVYQNMIANCAAVGLIESRNLWDIRYKRAKINNDFPIWVSKPLILFNKYWWGFGYEKWRILVIWLPLMFLVFFVINTFIALSLNNSVYKDKDLKFDEFRVKLSALKERKSPWYMWVWFKMKYSFFYTASIYFGLRIKHGDLNYNHFGGLIYIYLIYLSGTLHLAFSLSYILAIY